MESYEVSLPRVPKYLHRREASGASSQTAALKCQTRKGGALPGRRQGLHRAQRSGRAHDAAGAAQPGTGPGHPAKQSQAPSLLALQSGGRFMAWLPAPADPSRLPAVLSLFPQSHQPAWPVTSQSSCGLRVCLLGSALSASSPGRRSLVRPQVLSYLFADTFFPDLCLGPWRNVGTSGLLPSPPAA